MIDLHDIQWALLLKKADRYKQESGAWRARCIYAWIAIGALVIWLVVMAAVCAKGEEFSRSGFMDCNDSNPNHEKTCAPECTRREGQSPVSGPKRQHLDVFHSIAPLPQADGQRASGRAALPILHNIPGAGRCFLTL